MRNFDYMKLSERMWDTEIVSYIAKIHECKGRQELFVRQKPIELERLVEIARIQSTEASNKIEGIVTTSTRIKQLMNEKTTPRNRDENEIVGYRDVLNTIHESHDYIPIRPSYILQLHRDLLKRAGMSYGGHFKNVQNYINETKPDGTQITRFTPVAPYETEEAVAAICSSYERTLSMETVDPLILIPVFICDFLCIHPFNDGNGRMSRLLTLLLLYQNGYEVGKYISIEKQIEKTKDVYYDVLQGADYGWHEEKNDPTPFIRYMLKIILACYTEFEERVGMMNDSGVKSSAYDMVKSYVMNKLGKFTSADIIVSCPGAGRSAILAALKKLTEEGMVIKCGGGRGTYYVRKDALK
ncbi:MAG: Fic family protein [Lachnospiraceae bacterium]